MNRSTSVALLMACCVLAVRPASAEEVVRTIRWEELAAAGTLTSGTVAGAASGGVGASLRVAHPGPAGARLRLVTIERPGIRTLRYAVRGRVTYEGVAGGSYLEMWNYFADGAFFSRTLGQQGPMGQLAGSSGWREFVLPFFNREGGLPPEKLEVNLVLTGAGTVDIGPLEIVQFDAGEDPLASGGAWWNDRQAGLLGGILGSALGVLGAVIGTLGSAGRAKGFVLGALKGMAWLGVGGLALAGTALLEGQPYAVYYPLFLIGAISAALGFALPSSLKKRYQELELRRMQALDA